MRQAVRSERAPRSPLSRRTLGEWIGARDGHEPDLGQSEAPEKPCEEGQVDERTQRIGLNEAVFREVERASRTWESRSRNQVGNST